MTCNVSSLQELAVSALVKELSRDSCIDTVAVPPELARRVAEVAPLEARWSLLTQLAHLGTLSGDTWRELWTSDFESFAGGLNLSVAGCPLVTASDLTAVALRCGTSQPPPGAMPTADAVPLAGAGARATPAECYAARNVGAATAAAVDAGCGDQGARPTGDSRGAVAGGVSVLPLTPLMCTAAGLSQLKSISLHGCHHSTDADMQQLLRLLTCDSPGGGGAGGCGLRALDVSSCHQLGNAAVAAVAAALGGCLTSLDISNCWQVTDVAALSLCRQLRTLRMSGCWQLALAGPCCDTSPAPDAAAGGLPPARALAALLAALLPTLTELDLSGIPQLCDADLQPLWLPIGGGGSGSAGGSSGGAAGPSGAKAPAHGCLVACSLSGTAISSDLPPRLAAACPALAHWRLSGCRNLDGCAVLVAARDRAAAHQPPQPRIPPPPAPWLTLAAADLGGWEEEPEVVMSAGVLEEVAAVAAAAAEAAAAALVPAAPAAGAGGGHVQDGGAGSSGSIAGREAAPSGPGAISVEALAAAGMVEDLFELGAAAAAAVASGAPGGGGGGFGGTRSAMAVAAAAPGTALRQLTSLDLSRTPQVSSMTAARLAACCGPSLTSLTLAGCTALGDEGLAHLAEQLTAAAGAAAAAAVGPGAGAGIAAPPGLAPAGAGPAPGAGGTGQRLVSLDLTDCAPPRGVGRARVPGSAFFRPPAAGAGPSAAGHTGTSASGLGVSGGLRYHSGGGGSSSATHKQPRRGGITDRGIADLLLALHRGTAPTTGAVAAGSEISPASVGGAGIGAGGDGSGWGLRSLSLGGTAAGEGALRAASGLTRLELQGCRGVADLALLQALEHCPDLRVLKLWMCALVGGGPGRWRRQPCSCCSGSCRRQQLNSQGVTQHPAAAGAAPAPPLHAAGCAALGSPLWALTYLDLASPSGAKVGGTVSPGAAGTGTKATVCSVAGVRGGGSGEGSGPAGVSDAMLISLAAACPLLRTVRLRGVTAVSDAGVMNLLLGCRLLRRLCVAGAPAVTDATLALALQLASAAIAGNGDVAVERGAAGNELRCRPWCGDHEYKLSPHGSGAALGAGSSSGSSSGGGRPPGSLLHLELPGCSAITGGGCSAVVNCCRPHWQAFCVVACTLPN
ncbi:hypothetical protein HXX76_007138 [Chlamydomonas incerta]|uniref:Uncharacterized protein n=1 Tax=Chlamydomonas incerta TaxID=51695 RepID=A0A835W3I6_CHLIN|nr:hypothetical protein HXX76_007138 [Chlamydomonas incerta]|eukprot:KAG2435943.1 hypothetical protein HXX76_007138 [Chlamydomonas incerta]